MENPNQMTSFSNRYDGIHGMLPRERMAPEVRKLIYTYEMKPGAPFYHREFGFFCLNRWAKEGLPEKPDLNAIFGFDPPAEHWFLWEAGWCDPPYCPWFEQKVLEDRGEYELVQDVSGREVLFFKGRRSGFMPTYDTNVHSKEY